MKLLVLGAGVVGLTAALVLSRRGHEVQVVAKEWTPHTTSDVAAAFWYPFKAEPVDKVTAWAAQSFDQFRQLEQVPEAGVCKKRLIEYSTSPLEVPEWTSVAEDYQEGNEVIPPGFTNAFSFQTYVVDMTLYMPFLLRCCSEAGIKFKTQTVHSPADIETDSNIVINCTGLGSRDLFNDNELIAAKGQVVRIEHNDSHDSIRMYHGDGPQFSMVVPRGHDTVLGGTYEESFSSTAVDHLEVERIVRDCKILLPEIGEIKLLGTASGLRPVRSQVRLECHRLTGDKYVIHNYGHGGAGITLSWGCAAAVADLVDSISNML